MRKFFAIVLLALLGLSFASPLLASSRMGDSKLPACCRKAAKHHCAAMDAMAMDDTALSTDADQHAHFSSRMECCGCCGFMVASAGHATMLFVVTNAVSAMTPRSTRANLAPQQSDVLHADHVDANNKRGPPANLPHSI